VVVLSNVLTDISDFARMVQRETGYPYVLGGIEHGLSAIGRAIWWAETAPSVSERMPVRAAGPSPVSGTGTWAEHQAAMLLSDNGIPVVPSALAADEAAAVAAANSFGYPVVLKAAADGLAHKSDIGGVRLGLSTEDAVRTAHREVTALLRDSGATGSTTLVQPQRSGGIELLVGVLRDPLWGLVLAIGLGGVWVEVLRDTAQRLLPVTESDVRSALGELRGAALLAGARGGQAADLAAVASVVTRITGLADSLGDRLESLEVNPLLVRGSDVEVLDALVTWRE
jgi:succinyl-CoA synthetase beta subunit